MKKLTSQIAQFLLILLTLPFYIVDSIYKNKRCDKVINKVNDLVFELNWWGNK